MNEDDSVLDQTRLRSHFGPGLIVSEGNINDTLIKLKAD
jgi:hypothetical protein